MWDLGGLGGGRICGRVCSVFQYLIIFFFKKDSSQITRLPSNSLCSQGWLLPPSQVLGLQSCAKILSQELGLLLILLYVLWVCMFCVSVGFLFVCVRARVCVCACACVGHRSTLGIFLYPFSPIFWDMMPHWIWSLLAQSSLSLCVPSLARKPWGYRYPLPHLLWQPAFMWMLGIWGQVLMLMLQILNP